MSWFSRLPEFGGAEDWLELVGYRVMISALLD